VPVDFSADEREFYGIVEEYAREMTVYALQDRTKVHHAGNFFILQKN
jgi:hypothetical protein